PPARHRFPTRRSSDLVFHRRNHPKGSPATKPQRTESIRIGQPLHGGQRNAGIDQFGERCIPTSTAIDQPNAVFFGQPFHLPEAEDRKSTRLNSSHVKI